MVVISSEHKLGRFLSSVQVRPNHGPCLICFCIANWQIHPYFAVCRLCFCPSSHVLGPATPNPDCHPANLHLLTLPFWQVIQPQKQWERAAPCSQRPSVIFLSFAFAFTPHGPCPSKVCWQTVIGLEGLENGGRRADSERQPILERIR